MSHSVADTPINRFGWTLYGIAAVVGAGVLVASPWLMPAVLPAVGGAFAFDPTFVASGGLVVVSLWMANAVLFAIVFADGQWRASTRGVETVLTFMWLPVMAWLVVGPRIFVETPTNEAAKFWLAVVLVICVLSLIPRVLRAMRS